MNTETVPPVLSAVELDALLHQYPAIRLLDVRTPGEYAAMHLPGAYNVPIDTLGEHASEIHAHVADPVVLVCQSGTRARRAEETLRAAGMPNLHVLDGGVSGWVAAGLPVRRGAERISLERQVRIVAGAIVGLGALSALLLNPLFALLPLLVGSGLAYAGVTDSCGMAMVLSRLPYNRAASCDVDAMVRALKGGGARPAPSAPAGAPSSTCRA
jgi:rhodanese-related sulfurtransferase